LIREALIVAGDGLERGYEYQGILAVEPGRRGGKPCGVAVPEVLQMLANGISVLEGFRDLTGQDMLVFAADRERKVDLLMA
jgi:uncharacterized protein (DUF433 family)